jgi:hypothetical protein
MSAPCAAPANPTAPASASSIRLALNKFMIPLLGFGAIGGH